MKSRTEFRWLNKEIAPDAAHFDIGPLEGFELVSLLTGVAPEKVKEKGLAPVQEDQKLPTQKQSKKKSSRHITVLNMTGKTPVVGIAYQPTAAPFATGIENNVFDSISLIHMLGYIGTGRFGLGEGARQKLADEFTRILVPKGKLFVAAAVGLAGLERTRKGMLHVFHQEEITEIFHPLDFRLRSLNTYRSGKKTDWENIAGTPAVERKEVTQVGLFVFEKFESKGKTSDKRKHGLVPNPTIELEA